MSMDLIVWKEPVVSEPAEVNALIDRFHDDADADAFQPSTDVLRFYDELTAAVTPRRRSDRAVEG